MNHTKVLGTGSYVPKTILTNKDFTAIIETTDEWITSRTGIKERRMTVDENTSDLAYQAALRAISDANIDKHDIDLIIVATVTSDHQFPAVSQMLQHKLALKPITAFDINAACSGFIFALNVADKMIKAGQYQHALIIGAETLTKITDYADRNTCVLFGDAAGAMIIGKSDVPHIENIVTYAKGDYESLLKMDGYPLKKNFKTPDTQRPFLTMKGQEVFKFATRVFPETIKTLLKVSGYTIDDIDMVIAHQANRRIIDKAAKLLDIPAEKMYVNIENYGNTSSASVPLAIDEAIKKGLLKENDLFITAAFGAGLTWGGALIRL